MNRLVQQARAGDVDAFGGLFDRYRDAIHRLCYGCVGNSDVADDLVQDTFLIAFERLWQLHSPSKFPAWLRRIAKSVCAMWWRSQHTQSRALETVQEVCPSSEADWAHVELHEAIHQALSELPEDERIALAMFHLEGYSLREMAAIFDVPISTVKGRLYRGRLRLRQHLLALGVMSADAPEVKRFMREVSVVDKKRGLVLVSDDEWHVLRLITVNLSHVGGYETLGTTWPKQTIELARSRQPQLIITDLCKVATTAERIEGKRLEGFRIIRALKADKQTAHIPIIVVSHHAANPKYAKRALAYGADRVIAKPFDPRKLVDIVDEMVKQGEKV